MTALDVLVVESRPGVARHDREALVAAGHRVHSCYDDHEPGFPCRALEDDGVCPLDEGVDVAIVVRRGVTPRPTGTETGVGCVIRAGVPLLESGPTVLDPFSRWITARVSGDPVRAVEAAAEAVQDAFADDLRTRSAALLGDLDVDLSTISSRVERMGDHTRITVRGPELSPSLQHTICVRMLDVVRGTGKTTGPVDVAYEVIAT